MWLILRSSVGYFKLNPNPQITSPANISSTCTERMSIFHFAKGRRPVRMFPVKGRTFTLCAIKHNVTYVTCLDNVDHRPNGNLNNNIKVNNSFHHFISNVMIWASFTILYFSILLFLISLIWSNVKWHLLPLGLCFFLIVLTI